MRTGADLYNTLVVLLSFVFVSAFWLHSCAAIPSTGHLTKRNNNPLNIDWDPAPSPEDGPPLSAGALRDPAYLPAQIGGIVGSYALSLVIVAILLLALAKTRRQRLNGGDLLDEDPTLLAFNPFPAPFLLQSEEDYKNALQSFQQPGDYSEPPQSPYKNFSLPSNSPLSPTKSGGYPLSPAKSQHSVLTAPSPTTTILSAGVDLSVDQTIVSRDRAMAQQQLEDMYKYVMEQEQAKEEGREYAGPPLPSPSTKSTVPNTPITPGGMRKNKPMNLNLSREEKTQSRGSSILSFLKSPRKNKAPTGVSISSPIMTPMSGTFPRQEEYQEMNPMPHRAYAPPPPPPVPSVSDLPFRRAAGNNLPTPEMSPVSTQSIDERIDAALARPPTRESKAARREAREAHSRDVSATTSGSDDHEPASAASEKSTSGLVGLPMSPKPGVNRFPSFDSLPASPRPGQGFNRSRAPAAIRPGGALPLRAYEPSLASPTTANQSTKQTVFTRAAPGPLSPGMMTGLRTPYTGAPVPYTPYQPFSPVVPITPSLVTKADRKRMRRLEPKTPTVEMVRGTDDVW
ncbi:hypothetical protein B0H66DRAFT_480241 [Apodospora peruviana]|uniref:Uncharacterized protein n=1 Tax=Apodospora peruviana TaxID=516989 RepID=A0AAE0I0I0_9PEZI|nr:hypothetical protein B0H66DRAFT_480241 [Apodospora peruviana]